MLPADQIEPIKKQLFEQLDKTNLPNKEEIKKSIEGMDAEQLEQFLKQNNLMQDGSDAPTGQQCIFCSLVFGDVPSTKVGENEKAIAILELNPISRGHTIVIPKDHISEAKNVPKEAFDLAEEISTKLKAKFKPKDITIASANLFGHEVINVLPVYSNETLESAKKQSTPEELAKLQKELEEVGVVEEEEKVVEEISEENTWLPKRIP